MPEIRNQRRLKILFLPAWYPSEISPVGGVFVKEHAKAASLLNDIVVLYAYGVPSPEDKGLYRVSEDIEDGIRTIRVRHRGILASVKRRVAGRLSRTTKDRITSANHGAGSRVRPDLSKPLRTLGTIIWDLLYFWSIFVTFRKLVRDGWRPDIIHAHVYSVGVPAVILGKLYAIPVVITEHYSGFQRHDLTLSQRMKARFAMKRAAWILPVSDDLRKHIETYGIRNRFEVVPPTINASQFHHQLSGDVVNDTKKALFVGGLHPRKGIAYLLQALNQIRQRRHDLCLDIVGDGPNRKEYEEMAQTLDLAQVVKFYGRLPKERLIKLMQCCDFLILPSLSENLPAVLIEAMACGKPVIASDVGGVKEIVNKENGILVLPKDVQVLKEAIEYMLDNHISYSPEKIARYARERFDYETVGKMLDRVYKDVLEVRAT